MSRPLEPISLAREPEFVLGCARVHPPLRLFSASGSAETIEPKVMQVLVSLARRVGNVVSRDELVALCWEGRIIGEDAIQRAVSKVRRLGEASGAFTVETIAKVGYRLNTPVKFPIDRDLSIDMRGRTNVPRRVEELVGREDELARLAMLLHEADLVTVTGAGGVGKTRIAHEVGRRAIDQHEDGVWLVEFASVCDPALIPGIIARVLGIQLSDSTDSCGELIERLKYWRAILILDNCEHLLDALAARIEPVLDYLPQIKFLVTSQEPLGIEGERVLRLRSLSRADAAHLFARRAQAADTGFRIGPSDNEAILGICAKLDGIPLAIEMAAARAPALGCETLRAHLDDRFRVLADGRRTALPRHRTLRAALDWSHSLLDESEATVFRRLGAFASSFTLEAAADVACDERIDGSVVLNAIASLVTKSLVTVDNAGSRPRYRLLETTRAYVQEKLTEADELNAVQRRYVAHFIVYFEPATRNFLGLMSDEESLARYVVEIDNVLHALEWVFSPEGDRRLIGPLVANTAPAFFQSSRFAEYAIWADRSIEHLHERAPKWIRYKILGAQALAHAMAYRGSTLELAERNVRTVWDSDDKIVSVLPALIAKAMCLLELGRIDEAERAIAELSPFTGEASSRAACLRDYLACLCAWARHGPAEARPLFDAALEKMRAIGALMLTRILVIEGSSSIVPHDDADAAIDGLRSLLASISPSEINGGYLTTLCAARLMMLLGLRGGEGDVAEARKIARLAERTRSRFVDFRYALSLACIALGAGQYKDAARIWGFANVGRARLDANFWLTNEVFTAIRNALLVVMLEDEMLRYSTEGASMTLEAAFRLAVGEA